MNITRGLEKLNYKKVIIGGKKKEKKKKKKSQRTLKTNCAES
jgi:hypothetical protein